MFFRFRAMLPFAALSAFTALFGQVIRTESVKVGTISGFYPGTSELTVTAKKRQNTKYLEIYVVDNSRDPAAVGLADVKLSDISVILTNLEKMAEESANSPDALSYDRPENKFSAGIKGEPEPSVSFMIEGVLVAELGRRAYENLATLQSVIELLKKGRAILDSSSK